MKAKEVRAYWAERAGAYSPEYYAHHGPNAVSKAIYRALDRRLEPHAPVLELGCSSGRHLAHLNDQGFEELVGIEVNEDAAPVMEATYPDLAENGEFYFEPMEEIVGRFDANRFGAVFSVETLQHLHPDADWVFDELARIAGNVLITAENEDGPERPASDEPAVNYVHGDVPLYYRNWHRIFTSRGFVERDAEPVTRVTLRTFQQADGPTADA